MDGENVETHSENNKLELYLNDLYEKECVFKTGSEEVKFIQTGIETLVQSVVDLALEHFKNQTSFIVGDPRSSESLSETFRKFRDVSCPTDIIKVGSFYEGTKNNFPDEFDFIFLLYSSENVSAYIDNKLIIGDLSRKLMFPLINAILGLANVTAITDLLQYVDLCTSRKIYFDQYMYAKGPSAKLQFIYEKHGCTKKKIHVDLVPSVRESGDIVQKAVNRICCHAEFRKEIVSTGSYLFVHALFPNYTFTETEARFMKHVLSKHHVKVYRILKYLLNGHGDDDMLRNYLHREHSDDKACKLYSSYRIKTLMIYHHYQCTDGDQARSERCDGDQASLGRCDGNHTSLGRCVLMVLNEMSRYSDIDRFPKLVNIYDTFKTNRIDPGNLQPQKPFFSMESGTYKLHLLPYLRSMLNDLKAMNSSEGNYDYERDRVKKSVTQRYFDDQSTEILLYERVKSPC